LYEGHALRFIGHAGSGFNEKTLETVAKDLKKRQAAVCPFDKKPQTNEKAFWTKLALVARIRFQGWTHDKHLRAPVFMGLEPDIRARDCRWEDHFAQPPPAAPESNPR
jgi:bifunctional non-homologous end joining protein LigD